MSCHGTICLEYGMEGRGWRMETIFLRSPPKIRAYTLTCFVHFKVILVGRNSSSFECFGLEREAKLGRGTYRPVGIHRVPRASTLPLQREE